MTDRDRLERIYRRLTPTITESVGFLMRLNALQAGEAVHPDELFAAYLAIDQALEDAHAIAEAGVLDTADVEED